MLIEIFVMEDKQKSQIKVNNNEIETLNELPNGLKRRLTATLNRVQARQIITASKIENTIFVFASRNKLLSDFETKKQKPIKETLELIKWYFERHSFSYEPEVIGADRYCSDCKMLLPDISGYCDNPSCSSHKKWRMVIGPSYEKEKPKPYEHQIVIGAKNLMTLDELKKEVHALIIQD